LPDDAVAKKPEAYEDQPFRDPQQPERNPTPELVGTNSERGEDEQHGFEISSDGINLG
jgi:hypothetical protein